MKNASPLSSRWSLAARGWLLSLALLTAGWADAQNFVRNPDFNWPLGPDNWTIVYPDSSEAEFYIHDRTTFAHRDKVYGTWDGNYFGLHFRPYTCGLMEAYATQVVSNLTQGASYVVSAWMVQFRSEYVTKLQVWLEAVGGPNGAISKVTPYVTGYAYNNNGWARYSVTNTAGPGGRIEVRLHCKVVSGTVNSGTTPKWLSEDAFYDQVSVMPLRPTPLAAPTILSLTVTNRTAALKWTTVMNNTYDIEVSSDLATWSKFKTNLLATGTSLTYSGALTADPAIPLFFRIVPYDYVP
jgi:hypothetical protein